MKDRPHIQITLTAEQQGQIQQATGRQVVYVTLKPESLEARVAPGQSMN